MRNKLVIIVQLFNDIFWLKLVTIRGTECRFVRYDGYPVYLCHIISIYAIVRIFTTTMSCGKSKKDVLHERPFFFSFSRSCWHQKDLHRKLATEKISIGFNVEDLCHAYGAGCCKICISVSILYWGLNRYFTWLGWFFYVMSVLGLLAVGEGILKSDEIYLWQYNRRNSFWLQFRICGSISNLDLHYIYICAKSQTTGKYVTYVTHIWFHWDIEHTSFANYSWILWWRHQMETFSALLTVTGEFPTQRPVTQSFDVFSYLRLNIRLSEQSWGWRFETPSRQLWRH